MSGEARAILERALRLTAEERARLAEALQSSLDDTGSGVPADEIARLWDEESQRRLARVRERMTEGGPAGRDAADVFAEAEARVSAIHARRERE
jgi:hypothetical protein